MDSSIKPDKDLEFFLFYRELRRSFPRIDRMPVWQNADLIGDGVVHYQILSDIGDELVRWIQEGEINDVLTLLEVMEAAYVRSSTIRDPIYTDFVPALITYDGSEPRVKVRSMLKPALTQAYKALLGSYGTPAQIDRRP